MTHSGNLLTSTNDGMHASILEAARELFARFGYKKTTMEDIAHVLRKGKSSLYYYFKNKEEIFQAVISLEEECLFNRLHEITDSSRSPIDKMRSYVITRMETIRGLTNYQQALKDDLFGNYEVVGNLREKSETEEVALLKGIFEEGVADGSFVVKNTQIAAVAIATALKGLEVPLLRAMDDFEEFKIQVENILNILFYGVIKR
jgi:AcrR family transcriptional regulator